MRSWKILFPLFFCFCLAVTAKPVLAADESLSITSPVSGDAVQGVVTIIGTTNLPGFVSAEIDFSYHQDPTSKDWFLIGESMEPVSEGRITAWDTSTITDGTYDLRLVVTLEDGTQQTVQVDSIRVRNYTAVETTTPLAGPTQETTSAFVPTATIVSTPIVTETIVRSTSTPFPLNPAGLANQDILASLGKGGLAAAGLFLLAGLYLGAKSILRR